MKFFKKPLCLLLLFLFCSCTSSTPEKINFKNGTGEFDKSTIYLISNNSKEIPKKAAERKDTLIIGIPVPNGVFNPLFAIAANDVDINDSMWVPILEIDGNGEVVDGLAYLPQIIEEEKKYIFTLKENLKWEDGEPITTKDIEFTFKVLMDNSYTGTFDRENFDLLNWKDYRDGISTNIDGFKIIDDRRFSIEFKSLDAKKNYYFERIKPIAFHVYGKDYVQGNAKELEKYNKTPFGNGAYKFFKYIEGEELRLKANKYYFKGKPHIENVVFRIVNESNQLTLIENGDIDIIRKGVLAVYDNIKLINKMGFVDAAITDYLGYGYIAINHREPIMQDRRVRQALAYGLDRKTVVDVIFGGLASVIDIPQNTKSWFYPESESFYKYPYDPKKAKQLLEEAGWKVGDNGIREKDGEKLSLKFLSSSPNEINDALIPIMIENYKKIGIELIVEQLESKAVLQKQMEAKEGRYSYHLAYLFTPFANSDPDPSARFSTNGASNRISYSNLKLDKLLKQALLEMDKYKRKELYEEVYKEISYDLPYIFLIEKKNMDVYSSRVKGMNVSLYRWFTKDLEKLYF